MYRNIRNSLANYTAGRTVRDRHMNSMMQKRSPLIVWVLRRYSLTHTRISPGVRLAQL
jgi:hypothetical protein